MSEHDPAKHPERIPLDAWHTHRLQMVAECEGCGRTRIVLRAELIKRYGYGGTFDAGVLADLAPRLRRTHCERHAPKLSLKVVLDDNDVVSK